MRWWIGLMLIGCGGGEDEETGGAPTDQTAPVDADGDGVLAGTDCDDEDPEVFPGAIEVCDGVDQDCDQEIDEGATDALTGWADADGDGYGDDAAPLTACALPTAATVAGDCDDGDPDVHPTAPELCNLIDDDCDLAIDEDATDLSTGFLDLDGDGYGDPAAPVSGCALPVDAVTNAEDCDDLLASVHPGADELCNNVSDDCDAEIDEDPVDPLTGYADRDLDGFGDGFTTATACILPPGFILTPGDCDDGNPARKPGNIEVCDFVDNDCDFVVDEDPVDPALWFEDGDGDGYGTAGATAAACQPPAGYVGNDDDCYDLSDEVYPGQSAFFDVDRGDGSYDYDCDATEEEESTAFGSCALPNNFTPGWYETSLPGCGEVGTWFLSVGAKCSNPIYVNQTQACR